MILFYIPFYSLTENRKTGLNINKVVSSECGKIEKRVKLLDMDGDRNSFIFLYYPCKDVQLRSLDFGIRMFCSNKTRSKQNLDIISKK